MNMNCLFIISIFIFMELCIVATLTENPFFCMVSPVSVHLAIQTNIRSWLSELFKLRINYKNWINNTHHNFRATKKTRFYMLHEVNCSILGGKRTYGLNSCLKKNVCMHGMLEKITKEYSTQIPLRNKLLHRLHSSQY